MPITLREFTQAMNEWIPTAPAEVCEHLRPSTWKQIMLTGQEVAGGTRFSPQDIVDQVLNGRQDLSMSVALPVALMLNSRFGSPPGTAQAADERSAGGLAVDDDPPGADQPQDAPAPEALAGATETPEGTGRTDVGAEWIFPDYDYSREDLDSVEDTGHHVAARAQVVGGRTHVTWPDAGSGEVYRVVVSDQEEPYSPDDFTQIAVTEGTECWDDLPHESAARFITVWGYERAGGSRVLGQCRRVASKVIVHQLTNWVIGFNPDSRAVEAGWDVPVAPPGARVRVHSARLPLDEAVGRLMRGSAWMSYEIANNGAGFQDTEVEGGKTHHYVTAVEVEVNGKSYTSLPARRQVIPDAVVEAVDDLSVERPGGEDDRDEVLTVSWTQVPTAKVTVFRTYQPIDPQALDRGTVALGQLAEANLPAESAITTAAGISDAGIPGRQRRTLDNVRWPSDTECDTVYFTPVTIHSENQATIGTPVSLKRAGRVRNLTLSRRLDWDMVTFSWPGEATSAELRLEAEGTPFLPESSPIATITKDSYRIEGGVILNGGLPPQGGLLYATSVTYFKGEKIHSRPASIPVPAQWRYSYTLDWPGASVGKRSWMVGAAALLGRTLVEVRVKPVKGVTREKDVIGITLVHHPDRLPIHAGDGTRVPLYLARPTKEGGQEAVMAVRIPPHGQELKLWFDHSQLAPGYVRLLVDSHPTSAMEPAHHHQALERYVLSDPHLSTLVKAR